MLVDKNNIYVDVEPFANYPNSGISIYSFHLIKSIMSIVPEISFVGKQSTIKNNVFSSVKKPILNNNLRIKLSRGYYPGRADSFLRDFSRFLTYPPIKYDLAHGLSYKLPPSVIRYNKPYILTIHDLAGIVHSSKNYWPDRKDGTIDLKQVEKASAIITVSEFTKKEFCKYYNYSESKVFVTYNGPQISADISSNEASSALNKFGLNHETYFLSVGTLSPRKNFDGLIEAFKKFSEKDNMNTKLVIVGNAGWKCEKIIDSIKNISNKVIWLKGVSSNELQSLYKNAKAFFLVSHYEGFGIPLLEAMVCSCPTCYASGSAMDEVVADCGFKVNSEDIDDIAYTMKKYANDQEVCSYYSKMGLERSTLFTWQNCAEKTLKIYKSVLAVKN